MEFVVSVCGAPDVGSTGKLLSDGIKVGVDSEFEVSFVSVTVAVTVAEKASSELEGTLLTLLCGSEEEVLILVSVSRGCDTRLSFEPEAGKSVRTPVVGKSSELMSDVTGKPVSDSVTVDVAVERSFNELDDVTSVLSPEFDVGVVELISEPEVAAELTVDSDAELIDELNDEMDKMTVALDDEATEISELEE